MIITRQKPFSTIFESLSGHDTVALVGCGLCAASCQTGGLREVAAMAEKLTGKGKTVTWTTIIDGVCLKQLTRKTLKQLSEPGAYLVMACGSGTQTVAQLVEAPAYPALDSLFLGSITRVGRFEEKCSLCGSCQVDSFAGYCPITLCPKGLLNGPCGGMEEGKCETDREKDCVWYQIFISKEASGGLDDLEDLVPPRSHHHSNKP